MKIKLVALITLGLLSSFVLMNLHAVDMAHADKTAKTHIEHEAFVKFYENAAKEAQAKLQEHQKMYEEYEAHKQYYGRQGLDMESMCRALIHHYEQAAETSVKMVESHRKMAIKAQ